MDRSITQSLTGLIPALNGPLPPSLIELATSLLAQSRSRASSLKGEEEIARSYACANIACERLKRALNLPKIQPRPPCPPRTYQSLYRYLDRALPAHTRRSARSPKTRASPPPLVTTSSPARTPTKTTSTSTTAAAAASKARTTPSKLRTPSKTVASTGTPHKAPGSVAGTPTHTPTRTARKRGTGLRNEEQGVEVPAWTMPAIRRLCAALDAPAAPPHVFAGVSSILTLPLPEPEHDGKSYGPATGSTGEGNGARKRDKVRALIIAVFLFVATRLVGRETSGGEYSRRKEIGIQALKEVGGVEEEEIEGRDVDGWVREIGARGWQRLDWFANVREGSGLEVELGEGGEEEGHMDDEEDGVRGKAVEPVTPVRRGVKGLGMRNVNVNMVTLQAGLGTMMQDKVDYLSEERRLDYLEWKAGIMARIEMVERERNMVTAAG